MTHTSDFCSVHIYLHRRGWEEIPDTALGLQTLLSLFVSLFCLIGSFQSFHHSPGSCSIWIQVVEELKWVALVDKVEGSSVTEFAWLTLIKLHIIQESRIWSQLQKTNWKSWTLFCSYKEQIIYRTEVTEVEQQQHQASDMDVTKQHGVKD